MGLAWGARESQESGRDKGVPGVTVLSFSANGEIIWRLCDADHASGSCNGQVFTSIVE